MDAQLTRLAGRQGGVFSRRQALSCGYSPGQIADRLGDGRWERVRHGQYAAAVDLSATSAWDRRLIRHRLLVYAAVNSMRPGSVAVSHQSALVLHGVATWGMDLAEAHLTRLSDQRSGPAAGVRHHRGLLAPADLTRLDGILTTTPVRAVIEAACTASFESSVVAADDVSRRFENHRAEFDRLRNVTEFWPGSTTARRALAFRDPSAESVGESRLRVLMHQQGLPRPVLQASFEDAAGFVGRVDFYFPELFTVVEFDGLLKYAGGSADVLVREKLREDRLRGLGLEVVRVTWSDLAAPDRVSAQIRLAFHRAHRAAA
ncbi:type IV toxin-antitoxin system AbiEi family antitoxin domain-containing protein [Kribbella sp. DT2]|uniref:type IV toxin-antitoxin system AbiEi family antitoxin domain-containing protein n=1 Tax=Kribbella sp. DT2 TaxID=3393427 RepID=UPI003CF5F5A5